MELTNKKPNLNPKQKKVIDFLTSHKGEKFTLAEIASNIGEDIKTGTTNTLVKLNKITCHKDEKEIICPCCGHKKKVSTYEIA